MTSGDAVVRRGPNARHTHAIVLATGALLLAAALSSGCATQQGMVREMEVTAYCPCRACTNWERGSWRYLKLDFWNRYVSKGASRGRRYSGRTASGTRPHEPQPGLVSLDTLIHPWMLPIRLVFPWLWPARDGTVAADTRHYPFGTRLRIPGYGNGVVEDRGGAIKGPRRLDVYFKSHRRALEWGRSTIPVEIRR